MATIVTALDIERPVKTVWNYLTGLHNSKEQSTEVVDTVYSGPIRLGDTGVDTRRWGKREVKMNWEVTGYEPPRLLRLKYGPPFNAVAHFIFESTAAGATRLTCTTTLKPSGWMRLGRSEECLWLGLASRSTISFDQGIGAGRWSVRFSGSFPDPLWSCWKEVDKTGL